MALYTVVLDYTTHSSLEAWLEAGVAVDAAGPREAVCAYLERTLGPAEYVASYPQDQGTHWWVKAPFDSERRAYFHVYPGTSRERLNPIPLTRAENSRVSGAYDPDESAAAARRAQWMIWMLILGVLALAGGLTLEAIGEGGWNRTIGRLIAFAGFVVAVSAGASIYERLKG